MKVVCRVLWLSALAPIVLQPATGEEREKFHPVPRAICGPNERTESVQGQTTLAERFAPGKAKAYHCNLELVGQFEGEGAGADVEVFGNCAYYSTSSGNGNPKMQQPGVAVLDISDARHPRATAHLASPAMLGAHESLEIARRPNAQFRLISTLFWNDSYGSEGMQPVSINGRPYLIFSDNLGAIGFKRPPPADVCKSGKPGHGFARIIDLSDEQHPKTVSRLMPEAADPANCSKVMHDPTTYGGYGSFACSVDNAEDAKLLACGNFEAGLRVFDIRDPAHAKEVGYYKPPARRMESRPGSIWFITQPGLNSGAAGNHTADSVLVAPKFRNNAQEIAFTSADNGFQIVRFSDRFKTSHKDLFPR